MWLRVLVALAVAGALALSSGPAMATGAGSHRHHHTHKAFTCTGGEITSGHYRSIRVTGACSSRPMP